MERAVVTLVLGGARSGKSEVAERLVARQVALGPSDRSVTYVATGDLVAGGGRDPDWEARIAAHRARRPPGWSTVELADPVKLAPVLVGTAGPVLVDSLGTWLVGVPGFGEDAPEAVPGLLEALAARGREGRPTVVVSEEVGLGVHPPTEVGSRFRDALGSLNRRVGEVADQVLLVMAGRLLSLERP